MEDHINPFVQSPDISPPPVVEPPGVQDPIAIRERQRLAALEKTAALEKIAAKYRELGGFSGFGLLGNPVGELVEVGHGEYRQDYNLGRITTKRNDIPLETLTLASIDVAAIHCFGTDDPSTPFTPAADEPYLILVAISPGGLFSGSISQTWRSEVFRNIRRDTTFATELPAFRGLPVSSAGLYLKAILMEQQEGDPESVRQEIAEKAKAVADDVKRAGELLLSGSDLDAAVGNAALNSKILDMLGDLSLNILTRFLQDDVIDSKSIHLPADWLASLIDNNDASKVHYPPTELPEHIFSNYPYGNQFDPFWLFTNGDASYKVYFNVVVNQWQPR